MADLKILIVDDSSAARRFIASRLASRGSYIREAADGEEALTLIEKDQSFDLILTDIDMPRIDGIQLCKKLKADPATQSIPVIMISNFDSDEDVEKGFRAGASAYISKAEVKERLLRTIDDTLSQSDFRNGKQILVVEDSEAIRRLVCGHLARSGFEVLDAADGEEAVEKLKASRPDLILSDITMPVMDGLQLLKAIKRDPRTAGIPFVVMSVHKERRYMHHMVEHGAASYLVKPFKLDELIILIDRILSDQFQLILKEKERVTQERDMLLASITSLINALEARDTCTKGHSLTVAQIVTGMATFTEASEEEIERLTIGAKLHDVGKIGIRDEILFKKGRLTEKEYEIIKTHPVVGAAILESIPGLAAMLPMVLHHHERYDGTGYPAGLKGNDIPFWARMIAVADTFDAMIGNRPYRKGRSFNEVLDTIREVNGTQLCPECVEIFFDWISKNEPKVLSCKFDE
jgi:response regulator RpfG family c-di-GMP phosphodiesterase